MRSHATSALSIPTSKVDLKNVEPLRIADRRFVDVALDVVEANAVFGSLLFSALMMLRSNSLTMQRERGMK